MDRGTDPNSIAVELITLVTKTFFVFLGIAQMGVGFF